MMTSCFGLLGPQSSSNPLQHRGGFALAGFRGFTFGFRCFPAWIRTSYFKHDLKFRTQMQMVVAQMLQQIGCCSDLCGSEALIKPSFDCVASFDNKDAIASYGRLSLAARLFQTRKTSAASFSVCGRTARTHRYSQKGNRKQTDALLEQSDTWAIDVRRLKWIYRQTSSQPPTIFNI